MHAYLKQCMANGGEVPETPEAAVADMTTCPQCGHAFLDAEQQEEVEAEAPRVPLGEILGRRSPK